MNLRRSVGAGFVALALFAAGCGGDDADPVEPTGANADLLADVVTYSDQSQEHVEGEVDYDLNPPVGGAHNRFWQACGLYETTVPPERAVHSLEHGAVWIAHEPGLDTSAVAALAAEETHILVSPVEGMASPVVLSAWGVQLELDSLDDPALQAFVDTYIRQGPEAVGCKRGGIPEAPGPPLDT